MEMERNLALEENTAEAAIQTLSSYCRYGLVAWAVVMLFLTVIPGVAALANCLGLRRCQTAEERQKKADAAFDWCMVGTMLVSIVLCLVRTR